MTTQSALVGADRKWNESGYYHSVVESPWNVLPLFSAGDVDVAVAQLTRGERSLALRHKLVRVAGREQLPLFAAVTEQAMRFGQTRGLIVVGRIRAEDYRAGVFRHFGPVLERRAALTLAKEQPLASARLRFSTGQIGFACGLVFFSILAGAAFGINALVLVFHMLCTVVFAMMVALRLFCLLPGERRQDPKIVTLEDSELPVYTVLVPLFKETAVLRQLIRSLLALNYPANKLDIKLLLEQRDVTMHRAVAALNLPEQFDILVVPEGTPQTKPRALNYGLHFARGSLVTIYDSEDIPEPKQLRLAAAHFAAAEQDVACLQAALTFYNPNENWLTRQFTAEYASLFLMMLPQMGEHGLPLPLGGTSNHFRMSALNAVGGWDPFNVTEDADMGYRFAAAGYRCATLPSMTYEEANTEFGNWMKQRRRWLKGFLHTWLVQMRQPLRLAKATGIDGFWVVQALSIGVFMSALLHPLWMAHTVWFYYSGEAARKLLLPGQTFLIAFNIMLLVTGYVAGVLLARAGLRRLGYVHWWGTLCTMPVYWMMMAPAAWMGLWDFIRRPHHWHKTRHGLSRFMQK